MKHTVAAAAITLALIGVFTTACGQRGMMMNDDQMMEHMRNNPQMMGQMMNDPEMMERMMSNPQMMQRMMDQMMSDPEMMQRMSEQMMNNPEQCLRMAQHMSRNPEACRNMMTAMASMMDPASAQTMMGHCDAMMKGADAGGSTAPSAAAAVSSSSTGALEITVNVSGTGFSPASMNVKRGQLVRIHFKRDNQPTCAEEVIFPELNIRKKLPANQITTVELTSGKEGTLNFACGMDMMKGRLVVS